MFYIFTALFSEEKPFISQLGLKKAPYPDRHPVYASPDQEYLLAVTGSGPVSAAIVSSAVFTCRPPVPGDHIVNIGICAGLDIAQNGDCFLCSSITEADTGRIYYPDLLWKNDFPEAALSSGSRILKNTADWPIPSVQGNLPLLYDMEAAAIYQSAAVYAGPHQISFLKIVSDKGDGMFPTSEEVRVLIENQLPAVIQYIGNLPTDTERPPDLPLFDQLSEDLHCSVSMQQILRQYLTWAALSGISMEDKIHLFYESGILPCKDRKEGKKILEQFKSQLF